MRSWRFSAQSNYRGPSPSSSPPSSSSPRARVRERGDHPQRAAGPAAFACEHDARAIVGHGFFARAFRARWRHQRARGSHADPQRAQRIVAQQQARLERRLRGRRRQREIECGFAREMDPRAHHFGVVSDRCEYRFGERAFVAHQRRAACRALRPALEARERLEVRARARGRIRKRLRVGCQARRKPGGKQQGGRSHLRTVTPVSQVSCAAADVRTWSRTATS